MYCLHKFKGKLHPYIVFLFHLTSLNYSTNCFAQEKAEKVTAITKVRHFHHIKSRTLAVKCHINFFLYRN